MSAALNYLLLSKCLSMFKLVDLMWSTYSFDYESVKQRFGFPLLITIAVICNMAILGTGQFLTSFAVYWAAPSLNINGMQLPLHEWLWSINNLIVSTTTFFQASNSSTLCGKASMPFTTIKSMLSRYCYWFGQESGHILSSLLSS